MTELFRLDAHSTVDKTIRPSVVAVGNFDGVHVGHQALVASLQTYASAHNLATAVAFFQPQPLEYIRPASAPPRVYSWQEKTQQLQQLKVNYVWLLRFNNALKTLPAQAFVNLLTTQMQAKAVVVGQDFRFGNNREGNVALLRQNGLQVIELADVLHNHSRVSSTGLRAVLGQANLAEAERMLGRPYCITGRVTHGDKIGRQLGFPTANVGLSKRIPALQAGVYVVDVQGADAHAQQLLAKHTGIAGTVANTYLGAASLGLRPSISQAKPQWRLEVYLPHWKGALYGAKLHITFRHFLHGELAYPNLPALTAGISKDVDEVIQWHSRQTDKTML